MLKNDKIFLLVRHPFSRLISAYRDKIFINPGSYAGIRIRKRLEEKSKIDKPASFSDFVRFVLESPLDELDPHWYPYSLQCTPCQIKYSGILKLESLERDWNWFMQYTNINVNINHLNRYGSKKTSEEYLSRLSPYLQNQLYNKFKQDFLLFNYTKHL
ncbi:carbohydrate sulfotransferase 11 [Eurytemora carolleeae]|uniref:carbohydrate sulfotransferase 11 n=1 Tax=Eurytemora carolleeae TaxID=1294199 RepID=UPI000C76AB25|nr:carbohydrate sulfotransferase 11 [Eurytemora carolleeae]|eukprot:XP_023331183.1 carbohydrate sulfotransferase 11-like [Eurytemora affinis]